MAERSSKTRPKSPLRRKPISIRGLPTTTVIRAKTTRTMRKSRFDRSWIWSWRKTVDQPAVEVDDEVTWTIVVTHNAAEANTAATGVTVSDVFPNGTSFVSATPTLGTFDQNTGIWTLGAALQPGQSATLTVVSRIDSASGGQTLVNTAQVATQDQPDVDSTPGNGQQNEDDDDLAELTVQLQRPMSKRSLLATS